ncbi:SHOCT domain-containing protein [Brevibacterium oceani]|uniref:SHOCT domain-containing protein n=1 Tax=Brevibacterium oceani TaxID=358099 RepID=UPI001C627183|nr:SHOCT domain-containing protein [Brevibacterium oceani]
MSRAELFIEAKRFADKRAILRVVPYGQSPMDLPESAEALLGTRAGAGKIAVRFALLALVSVGFVWLVTVNAWDHEGFFPWFWNILWTAFPWFFLLPLWVALFRSAARQPAGDRFRRRYASAFADTPPSAGVVTDSWIQRTDSGGTADFLLAVEDERGKIVTGCLARDASFQPFEAPVPGDAVQIWRFADGWSVVQAERPRAAERATGQASVQTPTVNDQLAQLAALHAQGALTDAEFAEAKAKVLGADPETA